LFNVEKSFESSTHEPRILANADDMKKKTAEPEDDLRPHYDFDYSTMKPNRFAGMDLKFKGRRAVLLDEDVAEVFDQETVNIVLRSAIKAIRSAAATPKVAAKPKVAKVAAKTMRASRRAS
jgi:hypothetical protein